MTVPRLRHAAIAIALAAAPILAACGTSVPTGTATAPSVEPTPDLTHVPGGSTASTAGTASQPTQTDTEWGRIWDALPAGFPLPPDAVPTQTGEEGPVSGSFAIGAAAPTTADFFESALAGAGFSIESVEGPMEDGSLTVNAVGPDEACQAQVRIRPLSGTTNVVVLYGAGCPFE